MSKIEVRAWDSREKKMYFPSNLIQTDMLKIGYLDESGCPKEYDDVLMLWSGLVDCEGVKIFDGDIVTFIIGLGSDVRTRVRSEICNLGHMFVMQDECCVWKTFDDFDKYVIGTIRVIGNIYESGHLYADTAVWKSDVITNEHGIRKL